MSRNIAHLTIFVYAPILASATICDARVSAAISSWIPVPFCMVDVDTSLSLISADPDGRERLIFLDPDGNFCRTARTLILNVILK